MNAQTNTTDQHEESTYALLIRPEEKSRNALEVAIYPVLILRPLIAIWQLARQPINIPPTGLDAGGLIACVDEIQTCVKCDLWKSKDRQN